MANVNISCGIAEDLSPVVNIYVQEEPDSTGYVLTFSAPGSINLAIDMVRQAAKAEITSALYKRMQDQFYNESQIRSLLDGIGD